MLNGQINNATATYLDTSREARICALRTQKSFCLYGYFEKCRNKFCEYIKNDDFMMTDKFIQKFVISFLVLPTCGYFKITSCNLEFTFLITPFLQTCLLVECN